jgi:hypothetical protein
VGRARDERPDQLHPEDRFLDSSRAALPHRGRRREPARACRRARGGRGFLPEARSGRGRQPPADSPASRGRGLRGHVGGRSRAGVRGVEVVRLAPRRHPVRRLPVRSREGGARGRDRGGQARPASDRSRERRRGEASRPRRTFEPRDPRLRLAGRESGAVHPRGGAVDRARRRLLPDGGAARGLLRAIRRRAR